MTDFLPKDYKEQDTNVYMKLIDGENRFRILGPAIIGTEGWSNNKPLRWSLADEAPDVEFDTNKDGSVRRPKRFWAFPVWNYKAEKVQILEVTQITVQRQIGSLTKNPKWGSPFDYDIVVIRSGEGFDTEYIVQADPKEALSDKILSEYGKMSIDLDALFTGDDPFAKGKKTEDVDPNDIPL